MRNSVFSWFDELTNNGNPGSSLVLQIFTLIFREERGMKTSETRAAKKKRSEATLMSVRNTVYSNAKIANIFLVFSYPCSMVVQQKTAVFEVSFQVIYLCLVTNYLPDNKHILSKYHTPTNYVSIYLFHTLIERIILRNLIVHVAVNRRESQLLGGVYKLYINLLSSTTLWI